MRLFLLLLTILLNFTIYSKILRAYCHRLAIGHANTLAAQRSIVSKLFHLFVQVLVQTCLEIHVGAFGANPGNLFFLAFKMVALFDSIAEG